jgi:serine/threonine-protein kinase
VTQGTGLAWLPSDFAGGVEPLARGSRVTDRAIEEGVVSPDGRTLLYVMRGDLYAVPLDRDSAPATFLFSPAKNRMPRFSPDGRWVAFQSPISGRDEVYVTPWPGPGPRHQVSAGGGTEPVWSRDGRRLFYREGRKMMAATLDLTGGARVTARTALFEGDFLSDPDRQQYDVAPDGRFVLLRMTGEPTRISVVLNWQRELGQGR